MLTQVKEGGRMKIKIQAVSFWSIGVTIVLALLFILISIRDRKEFQVMKWMSFLLRAPCVRKELPVAGPLHVKRRITERS